MYFVYFILGPNFENSCSRHLHFIIISLELKKISECYAFYSVPYGFRKHANVSSVNQSIN